jgi:hypothetical protein
MDHAMTDRGELGFAAVMRDEPIVDGRHSAGMIHAATDFPVD